MLSNIITALFQGNLVGEGLLVWILAFVLGVMVLLLGTQMAVHLALLLMLFGVPAGQKLAQKRGDALIVDLPSLDEPANAGTPGPAANEPPIPGATPPQPAARPGRGRQAAHCCRQ